MGERFMKYLGREGTVLGYPQEGLLNAQVVPWKSGDRVQKSECCGNIFEGKPALSDLTSENKFSPTRYNDRLSVAARFHEIIP
jgi:hypothetical protein